MDETWNHIYDPVTNELSKEWRHSRSPRPKKFKTQKSSVNVLTSLFWDKDGILLVDYLEKGAIITAKYDVALLHKLKQQLVSKRRCKLSKGILFLQDNAAHHKAAITHRKLVDLHFEFLKHPAYSPDLAPLDYCLFPISRNTSRDESFQTLGRPHQLRTSGLQHKQNTFFWMG
jgi:histone-lysine N-methyltransferase SETMAR